MGPTAPTDRERVAIVTGGASGIGFASASRLAADGIRVVITDIDADRLDAAAARLSDGVAVHAIPADVTSEASVASLVEQTVGRFGAVDILVCSAGISGANSPTWLLSTEEWDRVIQVDLTGVFNCCRAVIPSMLENGWGRIVNIASLAGKEGNPQMAAYSAAKAGVIGLTKSIAKELASTGVLVNCVTPAVIDTPMVDQVTPEVLDYLVKRIPMGRMGKPEEVAEMVRWLSSEACSFTTGAVVDISGGRATY